MVDDLFADASFPQALTETLPTLLSRASCTMFLETRRTAPRARTKVGFKYIPVPVVLTSERSPKYCPDTACLVVFIGRDSSRALALSSLKPEDCRPDWYDLDEKEKKVLNDWVTFFSKRYNVVGVVEGATNKDPEGAA